MGGLVKPMRLGVMLVSVVYRDLIVSSGKTYAVKSVSTWAGAGLLDHKYLIIEAQD